MSLPIVLEIAVGLIFIYLTLSLVASEIQEILSALLQWRAEHLKRSIEQLLAGDEQPPSLSPSVNNPSEQTPAIQPDPAQARQQNWKAAIEFADSLYTTPLIENLNYEAQGPIAQLLRKLSHALGACYRTVTFSRNVFGHKTSGPSYIPAEAFATSLIERLKLADFQRLLMRSRFSHFARTDVQLPLHNIVNELRAYLKNEALLAAEMAYFDDSLTQITADLGTHHLTLETALEQIASLLHSFEAMSTEEPTLQLEANVPTARSFLKRIRYLRHRLRDSNNHDTLPDHPATNNATSTNLLVAKLKPSLGDLAALLDPQSETYAELVALAQREGGAVLNALENLQQEVIPPNLRASLATLSRRAETRIRAAGETTSAEIQQLQTEVENWFNHGMERASGVYRRNVKGVGLLIGLAIAFTVNADTLYMFQRLSSDSAIRNSIIQTAESIEIRGIQDAQALSQNLSIDEISQQVEGDLRSIGNVIEDTLADYPLPIGRTQAVIAAQQEAQAGWPIPFVPQRFIGWVMTAVALSMGASFWFDLLRKVMSVRASGDRPK